MTHDILIINFSTPFGFCIAKDKRERWDRGFLFLFVGEIYQGVHTTGKNGKQYTFSPYGLEKLEKEKWTNGSNFLFSINQILHKMHFQN